ncbi:MAG TPA: UDP-N-acetylglucosamine 2-epimerase [bacterium]|nr:UDP-N-acetylglucosamine 2-epimerase [bacterium]HPJ71252.1 UDP-N-acetylglucosamine 2-epimerase [bacterium]
MSIDANYELMFGKSELPQFQPMGLTMFPIFVDAERIREAMERAREIGSWVLVFCIGTKPCYYKFWGSIAAARDAGIPYLILDAGQHYDPRLTHGKDEFDFRKNVAVELGIRGDLALKSAELMVKMRWLGKMLRERWPEVTVVPVVLGDTILTSMIPPAWMFSRGEKAIQNEAGLRSMAPREMKGIVELEPGAFIEKQFNGPWELLRDEPMPEQFDTFTSAAGSEFHFAPLELNRDHLLREGHSAENIWVIGGVVSDALELKRRERDPVSVFDEYPQLRRGDWLRIDIHRRGNLTPHRFRSIVEGIVRLVEAGRNVNFVEMNATRHALDVYGLRPDLDRLRGRPNFLYTEVWPKYSHVIEFLESDRCFSVLTDSGGVQEEMNLLGKPCLTCRFNTDRPETVMQARSNLLVPPISGEFIETMVGYLFENPELYRKMVPRRSLYGSGAGKKMIEVVADLIERGAKPFRWAHQAEGFEFPDEGDIEYLKF